MPRLCRYTLDLNLREGHEGYNLLKKTLPPPGYKSLQQAKTSALAAIATAGGGTVSLSSNTSASTLSSSSTNNATAQLQLKQEQKKKNAMLAARRKTAAMALATKPAQAAAFNAFMLYMAGNQLNTFSISICSGAILSPLSAILNTQRTFAHLKSPLAETTNGSNSSAAGSGDSLQMPKLIFIALNLVWLAIGLYKMSTMRLLPTTSADWTHRIVWKEMMETTSIPPI